MLILNPVHLSNAVSRVKKAYENALATIAPYFSGGQVAAQPYSTIDVSQRGEIVKAAYVFSRSPD